MDEFTPGQKIVLQSAWETYRHKDGVSGSVGLADDGITCCTIGDNCGTDTDAPTITPKPTPFPTTAAVSDTSTALEKNGAVVSSDETHSFLLLDFSICCIADGSKHHCHT